MKNIVVSLSLVSMLASSSLVAFDGDRKGFIVGLGAGLSVVGTDVTVDYDGNYDNDSQSSVGLATSLKIGYGFTDQFSVYYTRNASWFGFDGNKDNFLAGMSGVAANYYIAPQSPLYVMAGIGFGDFSNFTDNDGETGSGFLLGGGYEVYPHVQVEASYLVTNIDKDSGDDVDLSTGAFHLTVNYLWY